MERHSRTIALLGEENFNKLTKKAVAVFGLGGVGSYCAEALIRSGIGTIYIYDSEEIEKSNINRQLIALENTVGMDKVSVAKKRYKKINPTADIIAKKEFITTSSQIPFENFDFIVDAVDNVTAKLFLIEGAKNSGVPIISVMGTGNKLNPEHLKISEIEKTHTCPLCRVMRSELKKRGIEKVPVVWSDEEPKNKQANSSGHIASCAFVPASAGLLAASYIVRQFQNTN